MRPALVAFSMCLALLASVPLIPTPAQAGPVTCFSVPATTVGTLGNDVLVGTARNDVIAGLGGKDRIKGGEGNDLIYG
jgi:RTX calcium-binding nonapeptide repeat (4 copies)